MDQLGMSNLFVWRAESAAGHAARAPLRDLARRLPGKIDRIPAPRAPSRTTRGTH
jgi:hypothetical protein